MKVTRKQLEMIVENEVRNILDETEIADRASGKVKQLMNQPIIEKVFAKLASALGEAGSVGSSSRIEEVALLLGKLGIGYGDITKITSHLRKDQAAAPEGAAPDSEEIA